MTFQYLLIRIQNNEEALYGHNSLSVFIPVSVIFTKSILGRFSLETVLTYLHRFNKMLTGKATENDFHKKCYFFHRFVTISQICNTCLEL